MNTGSSEFPLRKGNEMNQLTRKLRERYATDQTRDYAYRIELLDRLYQGIESRYEDFVSALADDLGKSETESFMTEIGFVLAEISYVRKHLKSWMRPVRVRQTMQTAPSRNRIYSEPLGLCLIISPWNYPFQLSLVPLIGALAAGNVCLLKTSSSSKSTTRHLHALIAECFPNGEVVHISDEYSHEEILAEKYDLIFYTGSAKAGKAVQKAAAEHLTPVILELGGKSPAIVDASANLSVAAKRIAFGKILNAGQTCTAPDYVLVEESVKEEFTVHLQEELEKLWQDAAESGNMPSIINEEKFDRLATLIDGCRNKWGGARDREKRVIQPAIFFDASYEDAAMQEEIFGPVLPILSFSDYDKMISQLKTKEKPLALYLFSENETRIQQILTTVSFGGGCVNDTILHLANHHLPFGGVGSSGIGSYHGKYSFDAFSHKKSVMRSPTNISIPLRYRPYTEKKLSLLKRILK